MNDQPRVADRMAGIQPFYVMELLARAKALEAAGRSIVHMEVGEPDFPTPEPVIRAGQRALAEGHTRYTPATGIPALREAIAAHYGARFGVQVSPARIAVTAGASGALLLVMALYVDRDDEVLVPDPGYPGYRQFVRAFEGRPRALNVSAETAFQPTLEAVAAAWGPRTIGLLLGSPANADPVPPHDVVPEEIDIALGIDRIEQATTLQIPRPRSTWAGLRCFSPDGDPVVGPDRAATGLHWAAALGGYGIQTSPAVGALCAARALGLPVPDWLATHGVDPERLRPR